MSIEGLLNVFLPRRCATCHRRLIVCEESLCCSCMLDLLHPAQLSPDDNETIRKLWGELNIQAGITLFHYQRDSRIHSLLEAMKYKGRTDVCQKMGLALAETFLDTGFFQPVSAIIPVPLSDRRRRWRGYNQSEHIAHGMSQATGLPVCTDLLERHIDNETQTHKTATERYENVKGIFRIDTRHAARAMAALPDRPHLLVIDDIITTGATLSSAICTLSQACPQATFSIASIATTQL